MTNNRIEKINNFIASKMKESNLPGFSLAIIEQGEVTYSKGYGYKDEVKKLPATKNTLYCIGSVTKSFTALAIMKLYEEDKLCINDEVSKYLDFKFRPFGEPILIKHLLDHTSGIPALAYAEALIDKKMGISDNELSISSSEDLLKFMDGAQGWVISKPGKRWMYSNEGYVLLGAIIEKVSGMDYTAYIKKHLLDKLKMNRTFFSKEDVSKDNDVAIPYTVIKDGKNIESDYLYGSITSDGGLISSVIDMANYIKMFLDKGMFNDKEILKQRHIKEMMKPRVVTPAVKYFEQDQDNRLTKTKLYNNEHSQWYGYGLSIDPDFFGDEIIGHGGSVGVATANMSFNLDKGLGVMILANGSGYAMSRISQYILALMTNNNPELLPFIQIENRLKRLEGIYRTFKDTSEVKIKRKGDLLQFEVQEKDRVDVSILIPEEFDNNVTKFFKLDGGNKTLVEFIGDGDGVVMIVDRYKFVMV